MACIRSREEELEEWVAKGQPAAGATTAALHVGCRYKSDRVGPREDSD